MHSSTPPHWRRTLLASLIGLAMGPHASMAAGLDLAQSPPGSVEPYVAPNIIISIDDSGSMDFCLNAESSSRCIQKGWSWTGATNQTAPNSDGSWPDNARRINVLKYALGEVFNDTELLPDRKVRIAWQAMWNNGRSPDAKTVNESVMKTNSMRSLESGHRKNFLSFVSQLKASGGTPSHLMFSQADAYMRRPLDSNSAWAAEPGVKGAPYLGCRRNYHIMMTDGRWNSSPSGGAQDNTDTTLPDGTAYRDTAQTQVYRDKYANTLADWAFRSWAHALQPTLYSKTDKQKQVPLTREYRQAPLTEDFGRGAVLEKYWNPRYNPATWPHLVTYTIGFSEMSYTWPGASTIQAPSEMVPFGFDGSFPDLATGVRPWPNMGTGENVRALDLWHAAINGRGRFFAVRKGEDLEKAFRTIVQQINTETEPDRSSVATSGNTITRSGVNMFEANYDPQKSWKGWIKALKVNPDGTTSPADGWGGRSTADRLDGASFNLDSRLILSWSDKHLRGVAFKWSADESLLSHTQKAYLNIQNGDSANAPTLDARGEQRLNFLRGDRSLEGPTGGKPFRARNSRQGDIVNSSVWYVGAPVGLMTDKGYGEYSYDNRNRLPMIYVGGNDGMLHGFSAHDGSEKIAYVPRGVIPELWRLTDPGYDNTHRYFVDGSPMSGDIQLGNASWRTYLVSSLGGGRGYFVLDVSQPEGGFRESQANQLVVMDKTLHAREPLSDCKNATGVSASECAADNEAKADIGHIYASPVLDDANPLVSTQFARLNNNRWAVIMGNGYNSINQRAVLLIQYLDGDRELLRLVAKDNPDTSKPANINGLSTPRLVDINGDGRPDVVYAGDIQGNLWKFDISSNQSSQWGTAFEGAPLYQATGPASPNAPRTQVQPITAPPSVRANDRSKDVKDKHGNLVKTPVKGMMVVFGTGRNITTADPELPDVQTLYSVLDNTRYKLVKEDKGTRVQICVSSSDKECDITAEELPKPVSGISALAQRKMQDQGKQGQNVSTGYEFWAENEEKSTKLDWSKHTGWYMDLPQTSERLLKQIGFYDGSNVLAVYTQVPAKGSREQIDQDVESCQLTDVDDERQFLTLINIMDGERPKVQVMDLNGDGKYNAADARVSRMSVSKGAQTMIVMGDRIINRGAKGDAVLATLPEQSLRPNWRQLR